MHMLIAAIVRADNKTDALNLAKHVFDDLVDARVFDYYNTFDDKYARARWGEQPLAAKLESEDGRQLLHELMDATKDDLLENLCTIRELLQEQTDEDIWNGDDFDCLPADKKVFRVLKNGDKRVDFEKSVRYFRHCCLGVGRYSGPSIYLYDENGEGIRDLTDLKHLLEQENKDKLWIVPADVHF